MGAAPHPTHLHSNRLAPARAHLDANNGAVIGGNVGAELKRAIVGDGDDISNYKFIVDSHPQQHFVQGFAHFHLAAPIILKSIGLGIGHVGFYIPHAVIALKTTIIDGAGVHVFSRDRFRKRHNLSEAPCLELKKFYLYR